MHNNNYKDSKLIKTKKGIYRLGALKMWDMYDNYIKLCKELDEVSLNCYQYPKWQRHMSYMLYMKKKLNGSLKNQESYGPKDGPTSLGYVV